MLGSCLLRARRCRIAGEQSEPEWKHRCACRREGRRGHLAQRPLDSPVVVEDPPPVAQVLRLRQRVEDLRRQTLVAQPAVETLHDPVLPRCTRVDAERASAPQIADS